jgi:hypothetical protein
MLFVGDRIGLISLCCAKLGQEVVDFGAQPLGMLAQPFGYGPDTQTVLLVAAVPKAAETPPIKDYYRKPRFLPAWRGLGAQRPNLSCAPAPQGVISAGNG